MNILEGFGVLPASLTGGSRIIARRSTCGEIAGLADMGEADVKAAITRSVQAFEAAACAGTEAGEFVRLIGEELRRSKAELGLL